MDIHRRDFGIVHFVGDYHQIFSDLTAGSDYLKFTKRPFFHDSVREGFFNAEWMVALVCCLALQALLYFTYRDIFPQVYSNLDSGRREKTEIR